MDYMGSALAALGFLTGLEDEGERSAAEYSIYEKLAGWLYGIPSEMTYQEAYDKGIINYIPDTVDPSHVGVFNTGSQYLGALQGISEQYFQTRNILGAQQKNEQTQMRNKFGETLGTSMAQSREASAKSGFASSGAIQTATEKQLRSVMGEYGLGRQSVYDVYQGKFLGAQQESEERIGEAESWRREMELAMVPLEHEFMPNWGGGDSFGRAARRTTLEAQFRREYMDYLDQGGDKTWEDWYKTTYPQYWSEERGGTGGPGMEGEGDEEPPPPPPDGGEEPPVTELGGYTGYRNNGGTMSYADWLAAGKPERDEGGEEPPVPLPPPPPPPSGEEPPPPDIDEGGGPPVPLPPPPPPAGGEEPPPPNTGGGGTDAAYQDYLSRGGTLSYNDWVAAGKPDNPGPPTPTGGDGELTDRGGGGAELPINPEGSIEQETETWGDWEPNHEVLARNWFYQRYPNATPSEFGTWYRSRGTNIPGGSPGPPSPTGAPGGGTGPELGLPSQMDLAHPITPIGNQRQAGVGTSLDSDNRVDFVNPFVSDLASQKQGYQETTGTALGFQPQRVDFSNPVLDTLQQKQKELDTFTNELTRMTKKKVGQTITMPTVSNYYFNKRF